MFLSNVTVGIVGNLDKKTSLAEYQLGIGEFCGKMLSVSPNSMVRSSLEEMLDSLRRRDENEKPKDLPPALPARPKATSRARLPSAKRPLPPGFESGESEPLKCSSFCDEKKEDLKGTRINSFGAKKVKEMDAGESPYDVASAVKEEHESRSDEKDHAKHKNLSPGSLPRFRQSEEGNKLDYFMKKKLHVWCRLRNIQWESGQIQSITGEKASVLLFDGSVVTVPIEELLPANPDLLAGVDDLIQLSYLNEPSVLHNLQSRYQQDIIYSKAGPVLVAVNPFKDVQLYGDDFVMAYRQKLVDSPHIYAVVDAAYNKVMTDEINQSIIISGESGSGKTETAKIAVQYLAAIGGGSGGIESEVLNTSCILEAFGNAKTFMNANSSRFGKLIEIHFSASGKICGAKLQTFLLEKSRVVQLAQGERSFHIFYQLCAGAPSGLRDRLMLKRACDYNYLNQSECLEIHDVDDTQKFQILTGALNTVRICKEDQEHAFEMIAAVLWLGNVSFLVVESENHIEVVADEAVINAASLIGCSAQDLMLALSTSRMQIGKDEVTKRLTLQEARDKRDALAKFIYASLFDWLVQEINSSLAAGKQHTGRSICILDLYGFESFKKNSFEQLCINYASERLQQHFNRHLLKLVQEEYEVEGIDWKKIDFEDNQDRLDLFEKRPIGLISLLDEESNIPNATDLTFGSKLNQHLNIHHCFKGETDGTFSVCHYAGEVLYDIRGFLEKNRDLLHSEIIQLLSSCVRRLPQLFASARRKQFRKSANSLFQAAMLSCQRQSVATKFKGQMFKLMQQLEITTPHFIHCINPNTKQLPGSFEKDHVLGQVRCYGVLEIVRISRLGYPTRMTHQEFTRRFGALLPENNACQDPLSLSVSILKQFNFHPEMYQVGYTKLYFRGQIGAMEYIRTQVLQGTQEVQKCFCGNRARRHFSELNEGVITLQSYVRGEIARKEYDVLLRLKKQVAHNMLDKQLIAVVQIQSVIRGWLARKHFSHFQILKQSNDSKWKSGRMISDIKDLPPDMLPSVVELQKRASTLEVTLSQKEKENEVLREQVQQLETRWLEYEDKMKSMEEMWQKQMSSLQMNLAAVKKSPDTDSTAGFPRRLDGSQSPHFYDSEETSLGNQISGVCTAIKCTNNGTEARAGRKTKDGLNAISPLVKEFERRKQNFDDEASAIVEVKSGQTHSVNSVEELRRLKQVFEAWKKDYKVQLREAKAKIHRQGQADTDKSRRKWWGKKIIKF